MSVIRNKGKHKPVKPAIIYECIWVVLCVFSFPRFDAVLFIYLIRSNVGPRSIVYTKPCSIVSLAYKKIAKPARLKRFCHLTISFGKEIFMRLPQNCILRFQMGHYTQCEKSCTKRPHNRLSVVYYVSDHYQKQTTLTARRTNLLSLNGCNLCWGHSLQFIPPRSSAAPPCEKW